MASTGKFQMGVPHRPSQSKTPWSWLLRGCTYSTALGNVAAITSTEPTFIRNPWVTPTDSTVEADDTTAVAAGAMAVKTESFNAVRFTFGGTADNGTFSIQVLRRYEIRGAGEVACYFSTVAEELTVTLGAQTYATADFHTVTRVCADTLGTGLGIPGAQPLTRADDDIAVLEIAVMNAQFIELRVTTSGGTATGIDVQYQLGEWTDRSQAAIENVEVSVDELEEMVDGTPTSGNASDDADGNVRDQLYHANVALDAIDAATGYVADASMRDTTTFAVTADRVMAIGAMFDDASPASVNEGDIGIPRMSANRNPYVTMRDAAGNERGVNVDGSNQAAVADAELGKILDGTPTSGNATSDDDGNVRDQLYFGNEKLTSIASDAALILTRVRDTVLDWGTATGGAATTITDTNKNWTTNALQGAIIRVLSGTGVGEWRVIVSNTATAITVATWGTQPVATDTYAIFRGGVATGAGAVGTGVSRVTLASDDPAVVDLAAIEVALTRSERTVVKFPLRDIAGTPTTTQIVAAQGAKVIVVHSLLCTLDVAGSVNVHGDAVGDDVCGELDFGNTGGCAMDWGPNPAFCPETPAGDALKITNTTGVLNGVIIASYAT